MSGIQYHTFDSSAGLIGDPSSAVRRYVGNLSCLAQSSFDKSFFAAEASSLPPILPPQALESCAITQEIHTYLMGIYFTDFHPLFPMIEDSTPLLLRSWSYNDHMSDLTQKERVFLDMIYSISSHHALDHLSTESQRHAFLTLANQCQRRAFASISQITTETNITTLRLISLAALNCLFNPREGNFGQLIGLASRLAIELSQSSENTETKIQCDETNQLYMSIFCLENKFCATLDRPTLLPAFVNNTKPFHQSRLL